MEELEELYVSDKDKEEWEIEEEAEREEESKKIDVSQLLNTNISKNLISMSFDTIVEKFNNFDFVLPKYQRKYVWDQKQIANLALSVIKNIPIPPIYVYQDHTDGTNIILDGQQRIISLFLYYHDLTVKSNKKKLINFYEITKKHRNSDYTLEEVISNEFFQFKKTEYKIGDDINITYSKLERAERRKLGARYIDVVFLDVKEEGKESVYSNIFNLLNSAGTPLAKQEIRNGVYRSPFYDMIHDLNDENKNWRRLFGSEHEKSRDVELLLRLVSLEYFTFINDKQEIRFKEEKGSSVYKGSYSIFLDKYSQEAMKFNGEYIEEIRENLQNFFSKFRLIDKKDLEIKGNKTINHLLLEALYVAYIKTNRQIDTIDNDLIKLIKCNDIYKTTIDTATSNKIKIEDRLSEVYRVIKNA